MRTRWFWFLSFIGVVGLAAVIWFSLPAAKVEADSAEAICVEQCNDTYNVCQDRANDALEACLDSCTTAACREACTDSYKVSHDTCADRHNTCLKGC